MSIAQFRTFSGEKRKSRTENLENPEDTEMTEDNPEDTEDTENKKTRLSWEDITDWRRIFPQPYKTSGRSYEKCRVTKTFKFYANETMKCENKQYGDGFDPDQSFAGPHNGKLLELICSTPGQPCIFHEDFITAWLGTLERVKETFCPSQTFCPSCYQLYIPGQPFYIPGQPFQRQRPNPNEIDVVAEVIHFKTHDCHSNEFINWSRRSRN